MWGSNMSPHSTGLASQGNAEHARGDYNDPQTGWHLKWPGLLSATPRSTRAQLPHHGREQQDCSAPAQQGDRSLQGPCGTDRQEGTAAADVPSPEPCLTSSLGTLCSHLMMISARNRLLVSTLIICRLEFVLKEEEQQKVVWTWGKYNLFSGF